MFLREGVVTGAATLRGTWLEENSRLIRGLRMLELKIRRPDSLVDDQALFEHYDRILPETVCSVDAVRRDWNAHRRSYIPRIKDFTTEEYAALDGDDYPSFLQFAGQRFPLAYSYAPGERHDGVTLTVPGDALNLLNPYVLEYLVPGYLPQKIEVMLRALPKRIRVELMPLQNAVEAFMELWHEDGIFTEQPIADAVSEFIFSTYGVEIPAGAFDALELPEYLQMKLAIRNEQGRIREVVREFPEVHRMNSALSTSIPAVRKWELSGSHCWPGIDRELPRSIIVSKEAGTSGFPAVVAEEDSVGRKVFLKEEEARLMHERGLLRLYRLEVPQIIKPLRSMLKIPHDMELSFFMEDRNWMDDMIDSAIRDSFPCPCWEIRSSGAFAQAVEVSRDSVAEILSRKLEQLRQVFRLYQETENLTDRLPENAEAYDAIRERFELLFRRGFLRCRRAFERYDRYLKALKVRAERALSAPARDTQKGADLIPYTSKLRLALEATPDLEKNESLYEFYLLYEEANINRFAPELKTLMKCGPEALKQGWDAVRL